MTYRVFRRPIKATAGSGDIEMQRMAELGRLSASLIHEISNPLSTVLIQLEQHKDMAGSNLKSALSSIKALRKYVNAARQQIRSESSAIVFSVNSQLNEVRRIITPIANAAGVKLKFELDAPVRMFGDPVKFQQIAANILLNAVQAYDGQVTSSDKQVTLSCYACKRHLHLKIQDWGRGIDSNHLPLIFSNFFSTKQEAGQGLGMGLFIVRQHVCGYFKGTITVKSTKRLGTQFVIRLPLKIRQ